MTSRSYSPVTHEKFLIESQDAAERPRSKFNYKTFLMIFLILALAFALLVVIYYFVSKETPKSDEETTTMMTRNRFQLHENFHLFKSENCHKINLTNKIQNSDEAAPKEFPFMVALFIENRSTNEISTGCGGSLISENIVLSASHCLVENLKLKFVRLGEQNLDSDKDCFTHPDGFIDCADEVQDIHNFTIENHAGYDPVLKVNDIALIKLNEKAKVEQNNIKTICLPFDHGDLPHKVVVTGFGLVSSVQVAVVLRKGSMEVVPNDRCMEEYEKLNTTIVLRENQFCALGKKKTAKAGSFSVKDVDTCKGDSGSPAFYPDKLATHFIQYGIVSYGHAKKCGTNTTPGIYVKVFDYLQWILDHSGNKLA